MRIRLNRRRRPAPDASQSPVAGQQDAQTARAVQRLIAAESSRVVPTVNQIDGLSEISDADIAHAVDTWKESQKDADTGLDGLLDSKVDKT